MTDKYNPFLESPTNVNSTSSTSSIYSSLIQTSPENSFSDASSFDETTSSVLEYQQLYNRYTLCLSHLHDAFEEVSALRNENEMLRLSNAELGHRVALLFSRDRLLSEFNRLTVSAAPVSNAPLVNNRIERRSNERVAVVPKSISVRSKGYLKTSRENNRQSAVNQSVAASQRVYIPTPGAEKEEAALECEVFNQGNLKTELCNKWQETGACPYGENCQFAHGIEELRPVIRHPRYKTEVCRMVLAGDICPYGHRCHFRHSLTEQERLMMGSPTLPR